jgi:small subunit ribosomal protein S27Ae
MAKKQTKNKAPSKRWEKYEVQGDSLNRKAKFCPKCGDGFFMAEHKGRLTCGKCGYTEFSSQKKQEEPKEE